MHRFDDTRSDAVRPLIMPALLMKAQSATPRWPSWHGGLGQRAVTGNTDRAGLWFNIPGGDRLLSSTLSTRRTP
jgi:hypothetical protein